MMKRLSLIDTCFLKMESPDTPMHVGALLTFRLPPKIGRQYLSQLVARLRSYPVSRSPFNHVLAQGPLAAIAPYWETDQHVDLDYHLRHSALPKPGGQRELGVLISRLHSHPLDLSRPPWECHIIEGLEHNRFAIYLKGHHAAVDGLGGLKLIKSWLSEKPDALNQPPPWAMPLPTSVRPPAPGPFAAAQQRLTGLRAQLRAVPEVYRSLVRARLEYPNGSLPALLKAPSSLLNGRIGGQRRFATQALKLSRLKRIAEQTHTTTNDVLLAVCGGALRRYLSELDALPRSSLVSLVPIALRPRRNQVGGNSLCGLLTDLETQIADPVERLHAINVSTQAGKRHIQQLSPTALAQYSLLLMAPLTLAKVSGLSGSLPPLFNVLISNVPAARNKLYFDGAELEGIFPLSVLFRGQALNITALGYAESFTLSFTACRDALPRVQKLAIYAGEALDELERALGIADIETAERRVVSINDASRVRERRANPTDGA
ncbi:wax ester/triacylglycerol synthase family O-acyltransferase [Hydrocarboniphaga effusa]|jgi:diacylglycerol O-acyltransferase|uniref:WS/DGAT/MGAT family O-acyltransferase n=1 Tax=Hydrocarboniphaga effusa TaxID=243629 RepID=UPI0031381A04